jgi:two-component system, OmpR family, sensor histidine kinase MtrB
MRWWARAPGSPRRRLRYRFAISFALGGLVLSTTLALITYGLIDRYLVRQRERTAEVQTYLNARAFRDGGQLEGANAASSLRGLDLGPGVSVVVHQDGTWYGTSVAVGRTAIPESLREIVLSGVPARQRTTVAGSTAFIIGLPVPATGAEYFEIAQFEELDASLAIVRNSLIGAAFVTTIGAALIGVWAGRRVLRPLSDVSAAATAIASGQIDRRLEPSEDPDLRPLTESFNSMVDALEARIERDRRFASDVSHELRSPLTTLAAAASVLDRRHDEIPARVREPTDLLLAEIARFQRLVMELLELSRSQQSAVTSEITPIVLFDLVRETCVAAGCTPAVIDAPSAEHERVVRGDRQRLVRILTNLLDNATSYGGGVTAVELRFTDTGYRIAIVDQGPGVDAAERDQIFERFFRGTAAGRRGDGSGTGLGLALVAEHVAVLGGKVWVEDAPVTGARFVVEIPEPPDA